jgi:hypothetical protein
MPELTNRATARKVLPFFLSGIDSFQYLKQNRDLEVWLHQNSPAPGSNRFHTTRVESGAAFAPSQARGCKEVFAGLCRLCWYPLYAFIRHRGSSVEDAQDLAHGFMLHLKV